MDARVLTYGYNEIKMLPLKKAWCDYHGLQMVYFDNESTDGSKEWAIKNNVFHSDIITDGAFDIVHIMECVENYRKENEYDWSLLAGVDMFLSGFENERIIDFLSDLDSEHGDGIITNCVTICRNDGLSTVDFTHYNQYTDLIKQIILLARGHCPLGIDNATCKKPLRRNDIWWFNMGHTKSVADRKETFERRKLAWERGLNPSFGNHYRTLANYQFTLPKLVTKDIRHTDGKKPYEDLCDLIDNLVY